jgi:HAD superfamily hydrolase (TIGR01509 family)
MQTPELVIFDCDGVLVDSEHISNRVLSETITKVGLPMTAHDAHRLFAGGTLEGVRSHVEAALDRRLEDTWLDAFLVERTLAFERELTLVEGAREAVEAVVDAGIKVCVASQGRVEKTRHTLGLTGLLPFFEGRIYSAKMVPRPKPFPDLFLHAAAAAGCPPSACVVIEDSRTGVRAAVSAGMHVLAYVPDGGGEALRAEGGYVFSRMGEVPRLLGLPRRGTNGL